MTHSITILPSKKINAEKWDRCINVNTNGLIYSTTSYLNALADNWQGLIINDYEAVMPLPWRKKIGIRYYYLPPFIQQLGITGNFPDHLIQEIILAITGFARYGDLHFNFSNTAIAAALSATTRTNFLIDITRYYDDISARYQQDAKEIITKAEIEQLIYKESSPTDAITLYHDLYYERMPRIKEKDYESFSMLCKSFGEKEMCFTRSIVNSRGIVLCSILLLKDQRRIYNLINAVTKKGREQKANYLLFDRIIREFAGNELLFDLEGSDLPGVKKFYAKFGVTNQPYFHYHHNHLPALIRYFKR